MHQQESNPLSLVVVGAGGLAHAALAQILSCSSASLNSDANFTVDLKRLEIFILDFDTVEFSNLNRQIFFEESDVGLPKAETLVIRLRQTYGDEGPQLLSRPVRLSSDNVESELGNASFVIDATDSVRAKLLINDYCTPRGIPFCYAGLSGDDGLVLPVLPVRPGQPGDETPCVRCVFPNFTEGAVDTQELTCHAQGVVGANVGVVGAFQGQVFVDWLRGVPTRGLFSFNFFSRPALGDSCPIRTKLFHPARDPSCAFHGHQPKSGHRLLDLTGEHCPRTFLFTKLALEKLSMGERLRVRFGSMESASNVKRSCEAEGHQCSSISIVDQREQTTDSQIYGLEIIKH